MNRSPRVVAAALLCLALGGCAAPGGPAPRAAGPPSSPAVALPAGAPSVGSPVPAATPGGLGPSAAPRPTARGAPGPASALPRGPAGSATASASTATAAPGVIVTAGPGGSEGPGSTPRPPTPAEAALLVLRSTVQFVTVGPRDPALVGQGSWYEAVSVAAGVQVRVRIGWDDCAAGCLHAHTWTYLVDARGSVTLQAQAGDPLPPQPPGVAGFVMAGPVCPVESYPPDPACLDRPLAGASLLVLDATGGQVARVVAGPVGGYLVPLPPGRYRLAPQPVPGLLGRPPALDVEVAADATGPIRLDVVYDTGIR